MMANIDSYQTILRMIDKGEEESIFLNLWNGWQDHLMNTVYSGLELLPKYIPAKHSFVKYVQERGKFI